MGLGCDSLMGVADDSLDDDGRAAAEAGFSAFVESAGPSLLRAAWLLTLDSHDAQDLAQEALARTYAQWGRIWRDGEDPYPYARRILTNLRTDRWRRRQTRLNAERRWGQRAHRPELSPETSAVDADQARRMLSALSPFQRRVLVLRHLEDLSVETTARILGSTNAAVKMAASRGLAQLRLNDQEAT